MANRNTARLLKPTSSTQSMASALSLQPAQLTSASVTHAVEEDLESQARASLSLFGFGAKDSVNWSPVSASAAAAAASATENPGTGGAIKVRVMERVCPIGTNTFLWNTMNSLVNGGEGGDDPAASGADPAAANGNGSNGVNGASAWENDASDWDSASSAAGLGNVFASKVLQQYLVKCVALLPSSLEEVVDLLVRSDREDMELPMQHLVGVRTSSSAFVYHRKKSVCVAATIIPPVEMRTMAFLSEWLLKQQHWTATASLPIRTQIWKAKKMYSPLQVSAENPRPDVLEVLAVIH
ncbi:uncharacterized protein KRP23_11327 [Phytophthora ramorum]|uniref:uncharacterized protein n=1 Tax=Phytophthora ramorum TaxID=164328 RepID=UPI00309F801F|nr:hypothetical protein KRP23_11327 [Phytophthora ramorum]